MNIYIGWKNLFFYEKGLGALEFIIDKWILQAVCSNTDDVCTNTDTWVKVLILNSGF